MKALFYLVSHGNPYMKNYTIKRKHLMIEITFIKLSTSGSCVQVGVASVLAPSAVCGRNRKYVTLQKILLQ